MIFGSDTEAPSLEAESFLTSRYLRVVRPSPSVSVPVVNVGGVGRGMATSSSPTSTATPASVEWIRTLEETEALDRLVRQIGRASCRERVEVSVVCGAPQ